MVGIMIPIKPDEYCRILNGKQNIIIIKDAVFAIIIKNLLHKQGVVTIVGCCTNDKKCRLYEYMNNREFFTDNSKNDFWYEGYKSINGLIPAYLTINDIQIASNRQFFDIAKKVCLSPEKLAARVKGKPYFVLYINRVNCFPVPQHSQDFGIPIDKCNKYKGSPEYIMKIPKRFRYIQVDWDIGKFIDN